MSTIAIDAVGIGGTGGGRSATMNLLREMLQQDTTNHYVLLLDRPEPELSAEHVRQVLLPVHQRFLCRAWGQVTWPVSLRHQSVELVHHIKNLSAVALPGRSIVTIYDMTTVLHPELYSRTDVLYWRHVQPRLLRRADRIIAISQQTANDLIRLYNLPPNLIAVIYPAYDPRFRPLPSSEAERVRIKYGLGPRYILHVGSISRKKNLLTLFLAFERLCKAGYDGKLVLVGRQYTQGHDDALYAHLERSNQRARVLLTGPVPDKDLPALYNAAELSVFPSLHEGFGLVAVEAMACGTPLICSSTGALPEVVGDGGVLLQDACDPTAIAGAMEHLLNDVPARTALIARGLERAALYRPAIAAGRTLALYRELLTS